MWLKPTIPNQAVCPDGFFVIRKDRLKAIKQENKNQNCGSKRWWSLVNNIAGRANCEVSLSSIFDPEQMNNQFPKYEYGL